MAGGSSIREERSAPPKDAISPVNIFWIARYDYQPDWSTKPHAHGFFQLVCTLDGRGTVVLEDDSTLMREDDIVVIPPRMAHHFIADRGEPLKTLDTKFAVLDDDLAKALHHISGVRQDNEKTVRNVLERIRLEGSKRLSWYRYMCNALLTECLVSLLGESVRELSDSRIGMSTKEEDKAVFMARNFMDVHFAEEIDSRTISQHVGYSPEYLSKRFKKTVGMPMHTFLNRLRIEKAQEMLSYEDLSIKEVAFLVGFKSVHHFSRVFKELLAVPPATWRDREREGIWKNVVIAPGFTNTDRTFTGEGQPAVSVNFTARRRERHV